MSTGDIANKIAYPGAGGFSLLTNFLDSLPLSVQPLLYRNLRDEANYHGSVIFVPPSLDIDSQRTLSLNLGGGACKWQPPVYDVPEEIDFHKTIIAGYPSGDKRMIFIQMEALTGWREYYFHLTD